jgi:uncharacterized protein YutE (UPF0331/DUF86 family)
MSDVIVSKIQSIQKCVRRAREEYSYSPEEFSKDFTRQDAAILNVIRACETTIDLANHLIKTKKIGVPTSSSDAFSLLEAERIITADMADRLKKMNGFRNMVVHQYTQIELDIVVAVITVELDLLVEFCDIVLSCSKDD